MTGWHRCDRFWKQGFDCPYREQEIHEEEKDDDDDPDDDLPIHPVLDPVPRSVPKVPEPEEQREGVMIPDRRKVEPPRTPDILEIAEAIVRDVPAWVRPLPSPMPPPIPVPEPVPVPAGIPQRAPAFPVPEPVTGQLPLPRLLPRFSGFNAANLGEALVSATIAAGVGTAMAVGMGWVFGRGIASVPSLQGIGIRGELAFVEGTVARYLGKAAVILGAARMLGIPSSNKPEPVKHDFPFHRGHFVNYTEYLDKELRRPELQGSGDEPKKAIYQSPANAITLDEDFE